MKPNPSNEIRDRILAEILPNVVFDGWSWDGAEQAALAAGYDRKMAAAVFPDGLPGVVGHFFDWADRQMMDILKDEELDGIRIRDRIQLGVITWIDVMEPWKEALRRALTYWAVPPRHLQAARLIWRTADVIWVWAGDTATDYNHYTKRGLLSGVIGATVLAWLNDETGALDRTEAFLDRRIDNVMKLGQALGRAKKTAKQSA